MTGVGGWIPAKSPKGPFFGVDRSIQPLRFKPRVRVERLPWLAGPIACETRARARYAQRYARVRGAWLRVVQRPSWRVGEVVFCTRREARQYCRRVNGNR